MQLDRPFGSRPAEPRRAGARSALIAAALLTGTLAASTTTSAVADENPAPLTDPTRAAELASQLGDERTGGTYYKDGRLVVTVTDPAAAQTVRDAGGIPRLVARSAAELASIQGELDELAGIPNTAWGVEARTNQVSVEIFDGVSAADRARIERVAGEHPGAVRIDRLDGKMETATTLRGANGITSDGSICSAAFNTKNSSGKVYTLTAGHCVPGTGNVWRVAHDSTRIGTQTAYRAKGGDANRGADWATIKKDNANLTTHGTVRYWGGVYKQIDNSRFAAENEDADRTGRTSQDKVGYITKTSVTVTYDDGTTMYNMYESSHCAMRGDSGGPLLHGKTALGIVSGGNHVDEPCGDSDGQDDRRTISTKVQLVLNERGLHVY